VGSRGRGAGRSALLGSVALHCATHALCPVVVVHTSAMAGNRPPRVVVGVDGSPASRVALAAAMDEAARRGGAVEVVAAYQRTDYWTDLASVVVPSEQEIRARVEGQTRELIDSLLAGWNADDAPEVRIDIHEGPAGEVLTRLSRDADLLVVGSRGRGAFRALLLGSIALHCAMHAGCPVMMVRPVGDHAVAGRSEPAMAVR
jgi:nucleotide-binding universal stress UspA family protein